jgi:hypothetical protein
MAKKLAILAILIIVLAAAYGAAAALNVEAGPLQAGGDDDLTCTGGVRVEYITSVYPDGKFHVDALRVVGLDACGDPANNYTAWVYANVTGPTPPVLFRHPDVIDSGAIELTQCFIAGTGWSSCAGMGPTAEEVTGVQVLIKNWE